MATVVKALSMNDDPVTAPAVLTDDGEMAPNPIFSAGVMVPVTLNVTPCVVITVPDTTMPPVLVDKSTEGVVNPVPVMVAKDGFAVKPIASVGVVVPPGVKTTPPVTVGETW